jgi:hypothetical protein
MSAVGTAEDVEPTCCVWDCCVPVALGSEYGDGEGVEEWVENDRVETARRVRGKMNRSA